MRICKIITIFLNNPNEYNSTLKEVSNTVNYNRNSMNNPSNSNKLSNKQRLQLLKETTNEENKYLMKKHTSNAQEKLKSRTLLDFNNPLKLITSLESEFKKLKSEQATKQENLAIARGLNLHNEEAKDNNNKDKKSEGKGNIRIEEHSNNHGNPHNPSNPTNNRKADSHSKSTNRKVLSKKVIENEYNGNVLLDDIEFIKKKNKLLEFIILQKARNKFLLYKETRKIEG